MSIDTQYETVSIEREASIQGEAAEVIATGVKMLIDPVQYASDPQAADQRPQLGRYLADVGNKSHTGVSTIAKYDIVRAPESGREFLVVEVRDAYGTDVLQLELEARNA